MSVKTCVVPAIKTYLSYALVLYVASGCFTLLRADEISSAKLEVSIVVPIHNGKRYIDLTSEKSHFHVLLSNKSNHAIKLWREWNSWGHFNLSFEATAANGKTWLIKKKPATWTKNFPDYITIEPGQSWVIDVDFAPSIWDKSPIQGKSKSQTLSLRAIYKCDQTAKSKKYNVWTGKITSQVNKYILVK